MPESTATASTRESSGSASIAQDPPEARSFIGGSAIACLSERLAVTAAYNEGRAKIGYPWHDGKSREGSRHRRYVAVALPAILAFLASGSLPKCPSMSRARRS
jgi:hypothetical protein